MAHTLALIVGFLVLCCSSVQAQQYFNFRRWVKAALISDSVTVVYHDSANTRTSVLYHKGDTLLLTGYCKVDGKATVYYLRFGAYQGSIAVHHIGFYFSTGYYAPGSTGVRRRTAPSPIDTLPNGRVLYAGPRKGTYYLDSSGRKIYIKREEPTLPADKGRE